jgi:hypothetical protein
MPLISDGGRLFLAGATARDPRLNLDLRVYDYKGHGRSWSKILVDGEEKYVTQGELRLGVFRDLPEIDLSSLNAEQLSSAITIHSFCSHMPERLNEAQKREMESAIERLEGTQLTSDRTFMREVIQIDGEFLKFASQEIRYDYHTVLSAVKNNPHAIHYAFKEIKTTEKVSHFFKSLFGAELTIGRGEITAVMAEAVHANPAELANLEEIYRDDENIVEAAIIRDPTALRFASERLQGAENIDFLLKVSKSHPTFFASLPIETQERLLDRALVEIPDFRRINKKFIFDILLSQVEREPTKFDRLNTSAIFTDEFPIRDFYLFCASNRFELFDRIPEEFKSENEFILQTAPHVSSGRELTHFLTYVRGLNKPELSKRIAEANKNALKFLPESVDTDLDYWKGLREEATNIFPYLPERLKNNYDFIQEVFLQNNEQNLLLERKLPDKKVKELVQVLLNLRTLDPERFSTIIPDLQAFFLDASTHNPKTVSYLIEANFIEIRTPITDEGSEKILRFISKNSDVWDGLPEFLQLNAELLGKAIKIHPKLIIKGSKIPHYFLDNREFLIDNCLNALQYIPENDLFPVITREYMISLLKKLNSSTAYFLTQIPDPKKFFVNFLAPNNMTREFTNVLENQPRFRSVKHYFEPIYNFYLDSIEINPLVFSSLLSAYRNNLSFCVRSYLKNPNVYEQIPMEIRHSQDFWFEVLSQNEKFFLKAPDRFRLSHVFINALVRENPKCVRFISNQLLYAVLTNCETGLEGELPHLEANPALFKESGFFSFFKYHPNLLFKLPSSYCERVSQIIFNSRENTEQFIAVFETFITRDPTVITQIPANFQNERIVAKILELRRPDLYEFLSPQLLPKAVLLETIQLPSTKAQYIKHLPQSVFTPEFIEAFREEPLKRIFTDKIIRAVRDDPNFIKNFPKNLINEEIAIYALNRDFSLLNYLPKESVSADVLIETIVANPINLLEIPKEFITSDLLGQLNYAPRRRAIDGVILTVLDDNIDLIKNMPKEFINQAIADKVFSSNIDYITHIPDRWITKEALDQFFAKGAPIAPRDRLEVIEHEVSKLRGLPGEFFTKKILEFIRAKNRNYLTLISGDILTFDQAKIIAKLEPELAPYISKYGKLFKPEEKIEGTTFLLNPIPDEISTLMIEAQTQTPEGSSWRTLLDVKLRNYITSLSRREQETYLPILEQTIRRISNHEPFLGTPRADDTEGLDAFYLHIEKLLDRIDSKVSPDPTKDTEVKREFLSIFQVCGGGWQAHLELQESRLCTFDEETPTEAFVGRFISSEAKLAVETLSAQETRVDVRGDVHDINGKNAVLRDYLGSEIIDDTLAVEQETTRVQSDFLTLFTPKKLCQSLADYAKNEPVFLQKLMDYKETTLFDDLPETAGLILELNERRIKLVNEFSDQYVRIQTNYLTCMDHLKHLSKKDQNLFYLDATGNLSSDRFRDKLEKFRKNRDGSLKTNELGQPLLNDEAVEYLLSHRDELKESYEYKQQVASLTGANPDDVLKEGQTFTDLRGLITRNKKIIAKNLAIEEFDRKYGREDGSISQEGISLILARMGFIEPQSEVIVSFLKVVPKELH